MDFELTPAREKELEKIAKDLPDKSFKKLYGKDWKSVKIATAMNILKKKLGFKEEKTKMKFKELREKMSGSKLTGQEISTWYRKNKDVDKAARKDRNIKKAVEIALDHGGAMNFAIKKIEKIKRGLADNPHVAKALSFANFGEDKDTVQEAKKIQDIARKHKRELQKAKRSGNLELSKKAEDELSSWASSNGEIRGDDEDEFIEWLDNNLDNLIKGKLREQTISEGTWAIPDSYEKMYTLQTLYLSKKMPGTKSNAKKFADKLYSLFGDDSFFDDLLRIEMKPDPKVDLRDILIKHLEDWNMKFKKAGSTYEITHAPKSWWEKEEVEETAKKRKSGNIKPTGLGSPMKGKLMAEGTIKKDPLDRAERILSYKLKELQYKSELRRFNEFEESKVSQYRMEANNAPLAKRALKRFKGADAKLAQRIANAVKPGRVIQSKLYVELGDLWDKKDMKGFEKHLKKNEK